MLRPYTRDSCLERTRARSEACVGPAWCATDSELKQLRLPGQARALRTVSGSLHDFVYFCKIPLYTWLNFSLL